MRMTFGLTLAMATAMLATVTVQAESTSPSESALTKVVQEIENLNSLRSGLAGAFDGKGQVADKATFQKVCKPVGMQAKKLAEENGWKVMQMADKYRNPKHQLDAGGRKAYDLLNADAALMGMWTRTEVDGQPGLRYFRRIMVEEACLMCHGPKAARPEFVQQGYPEDRAYDFKAGDLRGIYSVFVAEKP